MAIFDPLDTLMNFRLPILYNKVLNGVLKKSLFLNKVRVVPKKMHLNSVFTVKVTVYVFQIKFIEEMYQSF